MSPSVFPVLLASLITLHLILASVKGQGSQAPPTNLYRPDYSAGFPRDPYYYSPYPNHPNPYPNPPAPYPPLQVNPSPAHLYPYSPNPSSPYQSHFPSVISPNAPTSNLPSRRYYHARRRVDPYYDANAYVAPFSGSNSGYPRYQYATVASPSSSSSPSPQSLPARGGGGRGEEGDEGTVRGSGGGGGGPVFHPQAFAGPAQALPAWPYGTMEKVTSGSAASGQGRLYQLPQAVGGQGLLETVARAQRPSRPSASPVGRMSSLANNPLLLMLALNSLS